MFRGFVSSLKVIIKVVHKIVKYAFPDQLILLGLGNTKAHVLSMVYAM